MNTKLALELVGYAGSALIAVSLMMSSILRLRVINMIGGAMFSLYGLLIGAYPVAALNGFIVLINAFHVTRMLRAKEYFQILELRPESDYLRNFLHFYRAEIARILPGFEYRPVEKQVTLFILRDCNPVGLFIAEENPAGTLQVSLDFVVPRYRDLKIGRFLFVERAEFFRERGIREILIAPRTAKFGAYLVKVGFEPTGKHDDPGSFRIRFAER
ncbi:MAG: hypothetical protein ACXWHF_05640 [Chthoniobacterales bacterium]